MLPTPSTSHVCYDAIYEPAEDSFLFLDTLSSPSETTWLHSRFNAKPIPLLVELGPGSGVIIAFLTAHCHRLFGTEVLSLGVDVNAQACRATWTTVQKALHETKQASTSTSTGGSVYLSSLTGDLTTLLKPGEVDVLVFNPPYVPTDNVPAFPSPGVASGKVTFEESSHLLSLSYAGGADGMEVTNRLLQEIPVILSQRGVAYVLFCRGNKPEEVKAWINDWEASNNWSWRAETVGTSGKTAGWEKLEIVRIWREEKGS
ncbi:hypothetical protein PV11_07712 [Exophiala sideris]|uniref:Methyltransferase small domain-containing protein n=1 Tax=Exophiala sideris TaxID=1016849 RepID=A0A0D1YZL0_9EURO|nr:hypothetical protein PV11_07712 [Exophiala sideris]